MRISDLLINNDEDSSGDCIITGKDNRRQQRSKINSTNFECLLPRSIFARCLRWIRKSKRSRKVEREARREEACGGSLVNGLISESSSTDVSGRFGMEASFNVAVGFSLIYLTTIIKNEFSKMTELRTQMETLLKTVKETLQNQTRHTPSITSQLNSNIACVTSISQNGTYTLADSENISLFSNSFNCETTRQEKCAVEMNRLEAELEAELELLEVHLDAEMSDHPEEQRIKMKVEGMGPDESPSTSSDKVIMDRTVSQSNCHGGVSPKELEIKLHELIEARQEERIKELQENLEQVKLKLLEKEKEVSWWKDTAKAVYPNLPKTPHLSRKYLSSTGTWE